MMRLTGGVEVLQNKEKVNGLLLNATSSTGNAGGGLLDFSLRYVSISVLEGVYERLMG